MEYKEKSREEMLKEIEELRARLNESAECALRKSEEQYRVLVETSNDIIWSIDVNGYFTFLNQASQRVLGYVPEEMVGRHFTEFQDPVHSPKDLDLLEQFLAGKIIDVFETELFHKNGQKVILYCNAAAVRDDSKTIVGITGSATDMTSRKHAEDAIRRSEEKYRTLFEESKDVVFIVSAEGKLLDLNQAGCELLGCSTREEAKLLDLEKDLHWNPRDLFHCIQIIQMQGYVKDHPFLLQKPNGSKLILLVTASAQHDSSGHISEFRGIAKDITRQKRSESLATVMYGIAGLLSSAPSLQHVASRILETICRNLDCQIGFLFTLDSISEKPHCFEVWHEEDESLLKFKEVRSGLMENTFFKEILSSGEPRWTTEFSQWDNSIRTIISQAGFRCALGFPVRIGSASEGIVEFYSRRMLEVDHELMVIFSSLGNHLGQFIQKKRAEESLKESEKMYRSFVEDDLTGDYISTAQGKLLECNPAFLRIFGFTSLQEALDFDLALIHPTREQRQAFVDHVRTNRKLEYYEHELRNKKGEPLYVIETAIGTFDEKDELIKIKGYVLDNTERRRLELQLTQAQKMEAVGRLAGGVSHDFNNTLMAIISYAELALMQTNELDPRRGYLSEIKKAAEQGESLTRQLLAFSRRQVLTPKSLDLNESVKSMENLLTRLIGADVQLKILNGVNLGIVRADPVQIQQILMNLAVNARDAMPSGGMFTIETSNVELDQQFTARHPGSTAGFYVMLSCTDTGHGIDEATVSHIFEPFFTTKDEGKGTGLGLATVFGIVKQSGGYITVQSEIAKGTTFKIYLPRTDNTAKKKFFRTPLPPL